MVVDIPKKRNRHNQKTTSSKKRLLKTSPQNNADSCLVAANNFLQASLNAIPLGRQKAHDAAVGPRKSVRVKGRLPIPYFVAACRLKFLVSHCKPLIALDFSQQFAG